MLTDPIALGSRTAPSRVLFGPHVTNLAQGRALGAAHTAYYGARAEGGAGVVVTEVASVHDSDHPYAYAPRAADCEAGWSEIARACRPALVVAGLGHAGGQGSSAFHRRPLWAPSPVPDPGTGEVPSVMGPAEEDALVAGFAAAAGLAVASGCDGVEVAAGQHALLRQCLSPMTGPGTDELLHRVLIAVRAAIGDGVVGLRLGVDERAPWAGVTPERGVSLAARAAGLVDYLVPVRGSALAVAATRPDAHTPPGFLAGTCARVRAVASCPVVLAGSVVDPVVARAALEDGVADLVEMTRAQIADPTLVAAVRAGRRPRPCTLTNQQCRVRDARNPVVSCTVEPDTTAPPVPRGTNGVRGRPVLVVGGGPAGLEGARTLALAGRRVRLVERSGELGGALRVAARLPGRERFAALADWLADEVRRLGGVVDLGVELAVDAATPDHGPVLVATGAVDAPARGVPVATALDAPLTDPVVIDDPLGDGTAVALAEHLAARGHAVSLVTPDPVAGKQLARTGDLVDANVRLQRAGVQRVLEARLVDVADGVATVADVDTGARRTVACATLVDAGPRRAPPVPHSPGLVVAGDAVAPRTVAEAIREGRRAAERLARWCAAPVD